MKGLTVYILFIIINLNSFSQYISNRNKLGISGSIFVNEVFRFQEIEGAGWIDNGKGFRLGFDYSSRIRYNLWIHSGIHYLHASNDYYSAPINPSIPQISLKQNTNLFQFPICLGYHFLFNEMLYFRTGLTIDYQFNKKEDLFIDNQTGIGYSLEGGIKLDLENDLHINLGPEIQVLSIIPFNPGKHHQHFAIIGFNIVMGYEF